MPIVLELIDKGNIASADLRASASARNGGATVREAGGRLALMKPKQHNLIIVLGYLRHEAAGVKYFYANRNANSACLENGAQQMKRIFYLA